MTTTRRTAVAVVLALVLPLPVAAAGTAVAAAPRAAATAPTAPPSATAVAPSAAPSAAGLELPRPTGPYTVGRDTLHLVDEQRQDPWVPAAGPRQLMVSMFFPARPGASVPAPYMTAAEARLFLDYEIPGSAFPAEALVDTRTYAYDDARPAPGRFPLVVLSPGFELPRATLTGLAVDLASHGYVVALVDHTYESSGTSLPDGSTPGCVACTASAGAPVAVETSRAEDISFILDELTDRHSPWAHAHMIDPERIGTAGHSIGGAAALSTMLADGRVRAGVDLDGAIILSTPHIDLGGRPFLLIGNPEDHRVGGTEDSWSTVWPQLDGWKRWLTFTGSNHMSFTDVPVLAAQAGIPGVEGALPAVRGQELTRRYTLAFFDRQLKAIPEPMLDRPSPAAPEVDFQQP